MLYEPSVADVHTSCDSSAPAGSTPFAGVFVTISKEEHIRLRCEAAYWRGKHEQGLRRESALKEKIETLEARVRDLTQRVFGRRSGSAVRFSLRIRSGRPKPLPAGGGANNSTVLAMDAPRWRIYRSVSSRSI